LKELEVKNKMTSADFYAEFKDGKEKKNESKKRKPVLFFGKLFGLRIYPNNLP